MVEVRANLCTVLSAEVGSCKSWNWRFGESSAFQNVTILSISTYKGNPSFDKDM